MTHTEDEAAIRDLVQTWMTATLSGDAATVLGLMAEDVVFMVPGAEPFGKEAFAAAASSSEQQPEIDGKSEIVELKILDDWAFARTRLSVKMTPPGGTMTSRSGYTLTLFRKDADGQWRLARDANLLAPDQ